MGDKDPEWIEHLIDLRAVMFGAPNSAAERKWLDSVKEARTAAREHQELRELAAKVVEDIDRIVNGRLDTVHALAAHLAKEPGRG